MTWPTWTCTFSELHSICPWPIYETSISALDESQRTVQLTSTIGCYKMGSTLWCTSNFNSRTCLCPSRVLLTSVVSKCPHTSTRCSSDSCQRDNASWHPQKQTMPCLIPPCWKLKFTQYPAIHTNYSLSNCTISNKKDFNRSSKFQVIN